MIKPSDIIGGLGSAVGSASECAIKITSYAISGTLKKADKEDLGNKVESVGKILGETTSLTIKATSKVAGKITDVAAKEVLKSAKHIKENSFKKDVYVDGDSIYFYDEDKMVETTYKVENYKED